MTEISAWREKLITKICLICQLRKQTSELLGKLCFSSHQWLHPFTWLGLFPHPHTRRDQAGFLAKGQVMLPKVWPAPPLPPWLVRGCVSASTLGWRQVLRKPPSFPVFSPGADLGRRWFYCVTKCKYSQDTVTEKVGLTEWQDCMGIVKQAVILFSELPSFGISVDLRKPWTRS